MILQLPFEHNYYQARRESHQEFQLLVIIVLSSDPLARIVPLLLNATELTIEVCPSSVVILV